MYLRTKTQVNLHMHTKFLSSHLYDLVLDFGPQAEAGSHWALVCEEGSWDWSGSPCGQVGGLVFQERRTPWCLGSWAHNWVHAWAQTNCPSDDVMGSWHSLGRSSGLPLLWTGYLLASFLCFSEGNKAYVDVCIRF